MKMHRFAMPAAVLALGLAACTAGESAAPSEESMEPTQSVAESMTESADESMSASESADASGEQALDANELVSDPDEHLGTVVTVEADVADVAVDSDAFTLDADDGQILVLVPEDIGTQDVEEGSSVTVTGEFQDYNPAELGDLDEIRFDEAEVAEFFADDYLIIAEDIEIDSGT